MHLRTPLVGSVGLRARFYLIVVLVSSYPLKPSRAFSQFPDSSPHTVYRYRCGARTAAMWLYLVVFGGV